MGLFDNPVGSISGLSPSSIGGSVAGGILGGPTGSVTGNALGGLRNLFPQLQNTPLDPNTWQQVLGNMGVPGMSKGDKSVSTSGSDIPMPTLSQYQGLNTLGGAGKLNASTISESPWVQMAMDKQASDQQRMFDQAQQNQQSALAQGRANLAMRGGLSSGAAERMANQGANDLAMARQNILSQGASERANLGMQAADRGTDIAKFNAGQTQGTNQFNVAQSIADLQRQNEQNRFKYGEEMKLKGAGMSAQAMENSGKK